MKILSLFDGISCGMIALKNAGVNIERYVAYEIDKYAIKSSEHNFPMIEHMGDVFNADFEQYKGFDMVVGGSPCTFWSIAQSKNRETEPDGIGGKLFEQFYKAVNIVKPKFFIYENNKSMSKNILKYINSRFRFEPICINSALVSAQSRWRYYWAGKKNDDGSYSKVDIKQPVDKNIVLKDVLDNTGAKELSEREMEYMLRGTKGGRNHFDFDYMQDGTKDKGRCLTANISKGVPYNVCCEPIENLKCKDKDYTVYTVKNGNIIFKGQPYHIKLADGNYVIRKLTVSECKKLQTVPDWYEFPVSNTQALKQLGNGWTCDIITHLIKSCLDNK